MSVESSKATLTKRGIWHIYETDLKDDITDWVLYLYLCVCDVYVCTLLTPLPFVNIYVYLYNIQTVVY